jgi:hypothetical protein
MRRFTLIAFLASAVALAATHGGAQTWHDAVQVIVIGLIGLARDLHLRCVDWRLRPGAQQR